MTAVPSAADRPMRKLLEAAARRVNLSPGERFVSAAAGAGFVVLGLTRRRAIPGAALTMIGAGLFWRGFSGHSDLYGILGVDRFPQTANVEQVPEAGDIPTPEEQLSGREG